MTDFCLFKYATRDLLRSRRLLATIGLVIAPAAIVMLLKFGRHGIDPVSIYHVFTPALVFGFILVILSVVFGTGAISQEVEQKTIVYLLTRPVPRWRVLLPRFLAAVLVTSVTSCLAALLLAVVLLGPRHLADAPILRDLLILPVGAAAYGAVFLLLATLIHRPLLWGLLYAFGIESWAPYFPGIQKVSLMAYLRVLAPHTALESDSVDLRDMISSLTPAAISTSTAWWVLGLVTALSLAAALLAFSKREYVPREDAE